MSENLLLTDSTESATMFCIPAAISDGHISFPYNINWDQVKPFAPFYHRKGEKTVPAPNGSAQTDFRIACTSEALYARIICFEPDMDLIKADKTGRQRQPTIKPEAFLDDYVSLIINPDCEFDGDVFELLVNSEGARYCSKQRASAFVMEGDSNWRPDGWDVMVKKEACSWTVWMRIDAQDLGIEKFSEGSPIGINCQRHRTPQGPVTYELSPGTLAWTTQWTSELIHEAYKFLPAVIGKEPQGLAEQIQQNKKAYLRHTPGHDHETRILGEPVLKQDSFDKIEYRPFPCIMAQPLWVMIPSYHKLPGIRKDSGFGHLENYHGHHWYVGGTYRYIAADFHAPRKTSACIRQISIKNKSHAISLRNVKIEAEPNPANLKAVIDGNPKTFAQFGSLGFVIEPCSMSLTFPNSVSMTEVTIDHGEPFGGEIWKKPVPFKNICSNMTVQYMDKEGKWKPVKDGHIKDNYKSSNTFNFPEIKTKALRLEIDAVSYSGIRYEKGEEWKWFYEDASEHSLLAEMPEQTFKVFCSAPTEDELHSRPGCVEYLRYGSGGKFSVAAVEPGFAPALKRLKEMNPGGFFGCLHHEWDSNFEILCTVRDWEGTGKVWEQNADKLPPCPVDRVEARKLWERLFKELPGVKENAALPENSWRHGDHYAMDWGAPMPYIESTPNGSPSMQTQIAFARGAARQFETAWAQYLSLCMDQGAPNYFSGLTRQEISEEAWGRGPQSGASPFLYKRMLMYSYFCGAGLFHLELSPDADLIPDSKYEKFSVSPHGKVVADWLDMHHCIAQRSASYAPIALLLDIDHGYATPYQTCYAYGRSGYHTWIKTPYDEDDKMVAAFFEEIFPPVRQRIERDNFLMTNSRYGDLFDVIVSDLESGKDNPDILSSYSLIIALGNIKSTEKTINQIKNCLAKGRAVFLNVSQQNLLAELKASKGKPIDDFPTITTQSLHGGTLFINHTPRMLSQDCTLDETSRAFLHRLCADLSPVNVTGDVQRAFAVRPEGLDIYLANNKGIFKMYNSPPETACQADAVVNIQFNKVDIPKKITRFNGTAQKEEFPLPSSDGNLEIQLKSGEAVILRVWYK